VDRDQLVLGLAAVFAGLTTLLAVAALARQPFLLVVAVPFGATTYFLWYHASGRLAARAAERQSFRAARGGRFRTTRTRRTARQSPGGRRRTGRSRRSQPRRGPSREQAYRTLGLSPGASDDAVRRAYRQKVKEVHPDTESGDEESFKRVNRAYERLTD
jgi:DnaJ-domain-containing protein 1